MSGVFRIMFSGGTLPGFSLDLVRRNVRERLKATPEQLVRMFSGRPLVIKKDLDEASALLYLQRLQALGLDVTLEAPLTARAQPAESVLNPAQPPLPTPQALATPDAPAENKGWMSETGFADFARTHLNLARAEALLNGSSLEAAPAPEAEPAAQPETDTAEAPAEAATPPAAPTPAPTGLTLSGEVRCPHCGHAHSLQGEVLLESQFAPSPARAAA